MMTRSAASSGSSRRSQSSGMKAYSLGMSIPPPRKAVLSFPSLSRASFAAVIEPSASPPGFSWVTSRKRSCERIASATAVSSLVTDELVDQLAHANPLLHRSIVFEGQLRGSLHSQLPSELGLQNAVRGFEPGERRPPLPFGPEHADEDARVAEIGGGLDAGDGADPGVLQLGQSLRQHLPHGLVHPPHAAAHARTVPLRLTRDASRTQTPPGTFGQGGTSRS